MKKIIFFMLINLFLIFRINSNAYGFGLSFNYGSRPSAGKYGKIIEDNGGVFIGEDNNEVYLTYDCGYENGYTGQILDSLKETNTKAIFFITGHYLSSATDLVKRMVEEGHLIGNHTYSHKDFTKSSDDEIISDLKKLEEDFKEKIGTSMSKYVRPPRGDFDERSLKLLMNNGYKSVFWSLAYVDWNKDVYNGNNYSYNQVMKKIHNGAIILMHTVSKDNAEDMSKIINKLKNDGYIFKTIDNVI